MAKAYRAKWIIPSDGNVYEDCALIVDEGKVQEIIKQSDLVEENYTHVRDFANSVITPGFVNLHNHLQYSELCYNKTSLKRRNDTNIRSTK